MKPLRYIKDVARGVGNSMADLAMFPLEAGGRAAKQVNNGLDLITGTNDGKTANKKIDNVVSGITEQAHNREEGDESNVAYNIGEGLGDGLQLASALVSAGAGAKQILKQLGKGGNNLKPTLNNVMKELEKNAEAKANTKIPKIVETTNNPAPSKGFTSKPLNTSKARAEATMRKNMYALEKDAAQARADAEAMSLDDMLKQWKSQQNG